MLRLIFLSFFSFSFILLANDPEFPGYELEFTIPGRVHVGDLPEHNPIVPIYTLPSNQSISSKVPVLANTTYEGVFYLYKRVLPGVLNLKPIGWIIKNVLLYELYHVIFITSEGELLQQRYDSQPFASQLHWIGQNNARVTLPNYSSRGILQSLDVNLTVAEKYDANGAFGYWEADSMTGVYETITPTSRGDLNRRRVFESVESVEKLPPVKRTGFCASLLLRKKS